MLAISMGGVNAIVGTAISASLLPPIVNCGLCMAFALQIFLRNNIEGAHFWARMGGISLALFIMNLIIIIGVGLLTFRYVKNIFPALNEERKVSAEKAKKKSFQAASAANGMISHLSVDSENPISRIMTTTTDLGDYQDEYIYD